MPFECPVCQTSNPDSSAACGKCATPNPFLTHAGDSGVKTVAAPFPGSEALSGGLTTPLVSGMGSPSAAAAASRARAASASTLFPGAILAGRYEIVKMLGEGGMGTVYKAKDRELDRLVALKVIRAEYANHPETIRRFKQELILARQITHRNVIRIFDLGIADGVKFITMDFVEGRDLSKILSEKGKFSITEACEIVRQVCSGLEAAHNEGVVHRDLKPQNIMLDAQGRVFLMDFGLARSMELVGMTRTGALIGTPTYMSPEQARGEKADVRTDIFAFGVIFYELLTGKRPYKDEPMMATLIRRTKELATPPNQVDPSVPQSISDVVMKCLQIKTDLRYQTAEEVLRDLNFVLPAQSSAGQSVSGLGAPPVFSSGSFFGPRYRIESLLGEGGMGKVYKAEDGELRRTVALKLVRPELANDPSSMDRLKQEILLASRVSHKNILRIHDLGDVGGLKFISMAYVDGKDLHQIIAAEGKLEIPRAIRITRQLCLALEAAHAEGVIHRDLKPQNVLVDQEGQVYVSDFGLAKTLEVHASMMTSAGDVSGTPRYMSPEQVEANPVDHRSDLYSLGLILYEMVTADLPFESDSVMQAMYQRVTQSPKNPKTVNPELPDFLVNIIMRCLEKDPAQRYQHARDILTDLERGGSAPATVVPVVTTAAAAPRWKKPALWATAAVIVLAVAVSLGVPKIRQSLFGSKTASTTPSVGKYVAILPFRVTGGDESLQYTADGIVDALSAKLFQLKDVHLTSPAAAARVSAKDPLDKVARSLGAKLLVQGSVQGSGDRMAIVVSLDEPSSGRRLWSKEFSGVKQDLLTLQDQIYAGLELALDLRVTSEERAKSATHSTENISAYELYVKGRSLLGNRQRDEKLLKEAFDDFESATRKDAHFALAYTGMADAAVNLYTIKKEPAWATQALEAANQANIINNNLAEVHFSLGQVYNVTGKNTEAVTELKRALELAPNSDEGYRRLGTVYLKTGQKAEAVKTLQQAVDANPYYWPNHYILGTAYYQFGDNERALKALQRAAELEPNNATTWTTIGATQYRQNNWNESIAAFKKALDLKPTPDTYNNIATSYFFLGRYEEARANFEKAVEMRPQDPATVGNLADCYRWLGQQDKANSTYDRAINLAFQALKINPRDAVALGNLGLFYAKKHDTAQGLEFIRRARELNPNEVDFFYKEAVINTLAGRMPEALKSLREALSRGYSVREAYADPELKDLRQRPEFPAMAKQFQPKSGS